MTITLCRIDDRFIHGQIITRWVKLQPVERIIIVSDAVANDKERKTLVLSVTPPQYIASAVTVERMAKAYFSDKYTETRALLLFEEPQDVLRLIELGVPIAEVNVGGIHYTAERTQVTKSVSVSSEQAAAFRALAARNVSCYFQQLPGDKKENFIELMNNALKTD
jgi:fructose-specific PTS system IIB component